MKFSQDQHSKHHITAYSAGRLTVAGTHYEHPVIITPDALHPWSVDPTELSTLEITPFITYSPELVVLGLGKQFVYPRPLMQAFIEKNIGIEVMQTEAAVRTFNLLIGEGRRVVAGLIV